MRQREHDGQHDLSLEGHLDSYQGYLSLYPAMSVSVQHEIQKNLIAQVAYVGTKGTHLTAGARSQPVITVRPRLKSLFAWAAITSSVCNDAVVGDYFPVSGTNPTGNKGAWNRSRVRPGWTNMIVACTGNPGFASYSKQ